MSIFGVHTRMYDMFVELNARTKSVITVTKRERKKETAVNCVFVCVVCKLCRLAPASS